MLCFQEAITMPTDGVKRKLAALFGAHRFFVGKTRTAKIMLFTIGGLGIWYIIDLVLVLFGEFTDNEGRKIKKWP